MRPYRIITGLIAALTLAVPLLGRAQSASPANCDDFTSGIGKVTALEQDTEHDYLDTLRAELTVRRSLLAGILQCAAQNTAQLAAGLQALPPSSPDIETLRQQYLGKLADIARYYAFQETRISDLGLQGSRNFAYDLREWRRSNDAPVSAATIDLILWLKNQPLFKTAQDRIDQIGRTVSAFKLADNNNLEDSFTAAQQSFQDAKQLNDAAHQALAHFSTTDDPLPLIKQSLETLSDTYQRFSDMGDLVKTILPH
jgi:hypothetical protein